MCVTTRGRGFDRLFVLSIWSRSSTAWRLIPTNRNSFTETSVKGLIPPDKHFLSQVLVEPSFNMQFVSYPSRLNSRIKSTNLINTSAAVSCAGGTQLFILHISQSITSSMELLHVLDRTIVKNHRAPIK